MHYQSVKHTLTFWSASFAKISNETGMRTDCVLTVYKNNIYLIFVVTFIVKPA